MPSQKIAMFHRSLSYNIVKIYNTLPLVSFKKLPRASRVEYRSLLMSDHIQTLNKSYISQITITISLVNI